MKQKVLCVVDPNLKDLTGHHFEYDCSLMEPARKRGYDYLVLGHGQALSSITHPLPVKKAFSRGIWDTFPRVAKIPGVGRRLDIILTARRFYLELKSVLRPEVVDADWVVFGHMLTPPQLLGWVWWIGHLPERRLPRLTLLFRYPAEWFGAGKFVRYSFRTLERISKQSGHIRLATDSELLAEGYARLTSLPIEIFPIPHSKRRAPAPDCGPPPTTHPPLRLASLGNARDEKGFLEILQAIGRLRDSRHLDRFVFLLQSHDLYAHTPEMRRKISSALEEIKSWNLKNVRFLDEALDGASYAELLEGIDVVLLPYWRDIYHSRTSGLFADALGAGKLVIATENTWMSRQLRQFPAGLECRDRDAQSLTQAILELEARYSHHKEKARCAQEAWLRWHNAETLVEKLVASPKPRQKPSRIAVLYPWGDILERRSGASQRVGLLLDFLKETYAQVWVLSPGDRDEFWDGNVRYSSYKIPFWRSLLEKGFAALFELPARILTLGKGRGGGLLLWRHFQYLLEPSLTLRIEEFTRWAEVVILEYPFWAAPVLRASKRWRTKLIVTSHDVLSQQVPQCRLLRQWIMKEETKALGQADHAVCVSTEDQKIFRSHGVGTVVIPHPCLFPNNGLPKSLETARRNLREKYHLLLPDGKVCLFVGSKFLPNEIAVRSIREILRAPKPPSAEEFLCVTAGGCAPPEKNKNFISLGTVEASLLHTLYSAADLVLMPLPFGTGASVKTIEALGRGKPVLGTQVAFRGYEVVSGTHCVISDDLKRYPALIRELLAQPDKRLRLGENAKKFAEQYDYRLIYRRYSELIESSDNR